VADYAGGFIDIRKLYDEQGKVKAIQDWDDETAVVVLSVETIRKRGDGGEEQITRVRTFDKLKALELLGRHQNLFTDSSKAKQEDVGVIYLPHKVPVGAPVDLDEYSGVQNPSLVG
jgi:phage terminase small subunit